VARRSKSRPANAAISHKWKILGNLELLEITLLVTREYENLVFALNARKGKPDISFMSLPHPSGVAVNHQKQKVQIAANRNPIKSGQGGVSDADDGSFGKVRSD